MFPRGGRLEQLIQQKFAALHSMKLWHTTLEGCMGGAIGRRATGIQWMKRHAYAIDVIGQRSSYSEASQVMVLGNPVRLGVFA